MFYFKNCVIACEIHNNGLILEAENAEIEYYLSA